MKRIAVLTSGGDCSGMNAALRAVVRASITDGVEVLGIKRGFQGLFDKTYEPLTTYSVSNKLQRGGTFLQTARCDEMFTEDGQRKVVDIINELEIEGLIIIGGDGSLRGGLALQRHGVNIVCIPASIDNDIPFTDLSLGVDTALNNIIHAVDALKDTASSHDRTFVVEVMGRNCGYLALASALACGAEHALIPEEAYDIDRICKNLKARYKEGRDNSIIIVAEGAAKAQMIADQISGCSQFETRIMVLGHYQRGGSPSAYDRILATRFGESAVNAILKGETGTMVALSAGIVTTVPLLKVTDGGLRPIDKTMIKLSHRIDI